MNYNMTKIFVEIVCVVVRNLLTIWKKEVLKNSKKNA